MIPRLLTIVAAVTLAACASHPVPERQLAASSQAIEAAAAGAGPEASDVLALAREKMTLARRLAAEGQGEPSRWLAEQAEVDAELAQARSVATRAVLEAQRSQAALGSSRDRLATTTPSGREVRR